MKKKDLTGLTVAELKAEARSLGLVGYSSMKKAELVDLLVRSTTPKRKKRVTSRSTTAAKATPKKKTAAKSGAAARKKAPARAGTKTAPAKASTAKKTTAKRTATSKAAAKPKAAKAKAPAKRTRAKKAEVAPDKAGLSPRTIRAFAATQSNGEQQRVTAAKYYLGVEKSPELDAHFTYPESYGENVVTLMVRDPYWLYAYWELAPEVGRELSDVLGDAKFESCRLVLRVYDVTGTDLERPAGYDDIEVAHGARNWYINVSRVEREYAAELGVLAPDGAFLVIARSNRVTLPPVGPSEVIDEEWVTVDALGHVYQQAGKIPDSGTSGWGHGSGGTR